MKRVPAPKKANQTLLNQAVERHRRLRRLSAILTKAERARRITFIRRFAAEHKLRLPRDPARHPILLPAKLSLRENYEEVVSAVEEMRNKVLIDRVPVMIYFDRVEMVENAALILLASEMDRCRKAKIGKRGVVVSGNYPRNDVPYFLLRDMGFFSLIDVDEQHSRADEEKETRPFYVKLRTFDEVVSQFASEFCQLVSKEAFELRPVEMRRMVSALKEAMGNSVEHAYRTATPLPSDKGRWYVTGHVNRASGEMSLLLLDQGNGIPNTLDPTAFERIKSVMTDLSLGPGDGDMIAAATYLYRTSTNQSGRGRGFRDMKKFVETCDDGELRVFSNKGAYSFRDGKQVIRDHERSIGGTIVEWRIRRAASAGV